jgi:hypothetical protein
MYHTRYTTKKITNLESHQIPSYLRHNVHHSYSRPAPGVACEGPRFYVYVLYEDPFDVDDRTVHRIIDLTHVCGTFRAIALDTPDL